jgi:hypothetical protein
VLVTMDDRFCAQVESPGARRSAAPGSRELSPGKVAPLASELDLLGWCTVDPRKR